jgi:hypothetical protein
MLKGSKEGGPLPPLRNWLLILSETVRDDNDFVNGPDSRTPASGVDFGEVELSEFP